MTRRPTDLMFQDDIRDQVRASYGALPTGAGRAVATRFYADQELAEVPEEAVAWALGVGNPVAAAALQPGEAVLDIGCGGGIDSVLAARRVGPSGRVVGVDLLPSMCDRARAAAATALVDGWCEFLPGEMEDLPLPDDSVDVVIANGVLNLSPRKSRALREVARVLRHGGRLCAADLIVEGDLPPDVLASGAVWAGCIAGALSERVLHRKLERAGFEGIQITGPTPFGIDDVAAYPLFTADTIDLLRRRLSDMALQEVATAVLVRATIPAGRPVQAQQPSAALGWTTGTTHVEAIVPDAVEAPGVTVRHLKRVEDTDLKVLDVEPGGSTPFHTHRHAHEAVIIAGRGRLRLSERSEPLRPGSVLTVNPAEPHAIANEGSEPLRFVCMDCFVE